MVAAKDYAAADHYYQKALALNPQSQLVLLDLAVLRELQNRPKDAIAIYQKILQTDAHNDAVRKRLAELYGGDSKLQEAVAQLQREEQLETNPADTRTKIGLLYFERGDFDRAAMEFNCRVPSGENPMIRKSWVFWLVFTRRKRITAMLSGSPKGWLRSSRATTNSTSLSAHSMTRTGRKT
jgi:tetratricopeptide (TPR) repeat protein